MNVGVIREEVWDQREEDNLLEAEEMSSAADRKQAHCRRVGQQVIQDIFMHGSSHTYY